MADLRTPNILTSLRLLRGNTRVAVLFEPLWGIPNVLIAFYLSLYMKSQGITDAEIGLLLSLGCLTGAVAAFLGGPITDWLGRRRATVIFDFVAWPVGLTLFFFAHNFWMFAVAMVVNSVWRVVAVSWNLMVIEDADSEQRVAAYNIQTIVTVAAGILTPFAGLLVRLYGVAVGERILLGFGVVSIAAQVLGRNHFLTETAVGRAVLERRREARARGERPPGVFGSYRVALPALRDARVVKMLAAITLYMLFIAVGSFSGLYFAPYLTEALGLGKAAISLLGGLYSAVLLVVLVFVVPLISGANRLGNMLVGLVLQMAALLAFMFLPPGSFGLAGVVVAVYAVGFAIVRPFLTASLAEVTEGPSRAGIYAINNTLVSAGGAVAASFSGYLFELWAPAIWLMSVVLLLACAGLLLSFRGTGLLGAGVGARRNL